MGAGENVNRGRRGIGLNAINRHPCVIYWDVMNVDEFAC